MAEQTNEQQPGSVIGPGGSPVAPTPPPTPAPTPIPPPTPIAAPQQPKPLLEQPPTPTATSTPSTNDGVTWTASEFVAHEKSVGWYLTLLLAAVVVTAVIYLITRDKISSFVILICALALGTFAARKPKQLQYAVDGSGVTIGQKHFNYGAFKSFSVVPEDAFSSIVLMPLKRFSPLTTIYYSPADEEKIVNILADHLPLEQARVDAIDSFMRRIRF